ncbi:TetR family transcriptional regulator C-terminal domain-containing protein [Actinokineospora sp.]|uniref:TetR family transcriptional regulator C-terminal domain-containing protein n=1 Tax=Actinokineospora sp. TaxID=1872133 RepID=UPI004037AD31
MEMLPLSPQATAEAPVLVAFISRAVVEPALAGSLREGGSGLREFVAETIRRTGGDLDPTREAVTLLAVVDGLMTQMLVGYTDARTAVTTLDYHLDRIFGCPRRVDPRRVTPFFGPSTTAAGFAPVASRHVWRIRGWTSNSPNRGLKAGQDRFT